MKKFIPNWKKHILIRTIILLIIILLFVFFLFNHIVSSVLIAAFVGLLIRYSFEFCAYNEVYFDKHAVAMVHQFYKRKRTKVQFDDIVNVTDSFVFLFSFFDHIKISYNSQSGIKKIGIFYNYFSTDEFRKVYSEFYKRIPQNKILFMKNTKYNLRRKE